MGRNLSPLLWTLALTTVVLAGCAESAAPGAGTGGDEPPEVQATSTTGGIRGVVVDQAIVPIQGATVTIQSSGDAVETDETGAFVFNGLPEGTYFLSATHPLYDTVQQSAEVKAGVEKPPAVRFQLTRGVATDPYVSQQQFSGYISCSANTPVGLSEECGEGVGVPGLGRVGGNAENKAQIDFTIDSALIRSLIVEAVWEPSLSVSAGGAQSGGFNMGIYVDFVCDPFCGWKEAVDRKDSGSPMYLRNDEKLAAIAPDETTAFSTFTWASSDEQGVLLEQEFEVFVTSSYVLPMPEEWSLVNGDPKPF